MLIPKICKSLLSLGVFSSFLASAIEKDACFDRTTMPYTLQVDSHFHFQPFGGKAILFEDMLDIFEQNGVRFVNAYGIGQPFTFDNACIHYLDCPNHPTAPSIKNDLINAHNVSTQLNTSVSVQLAMSFANLANPESIISQIYKLDKKHKKQFKLMGEVNLMNQALVSNSHQPATLHDISGWKTFMNLLKDRNMPIVIHSDLGNDEEYFKYLHLIEHVLNLYPDNKIVWAHLGLSYQQVTLNPKEHIAILQRMLNQYQNLTLDMSWRIIEEYYFSKQRKAYVKFINKNSHRFISGSNFIASDNKRKDSYQQELETVSTINEYLDDDAFRNIALGQNYFELHSLPNEAPKICSR
ncbi:amidohydrolase [Parashewanella spongiae]|uniref:Amidohydrolase n=1 Tax=Parashewanella spongiae TaxID=342950 RepID=A0A3A6U5A3_9GAMM|nr:amidohydrolase [Parashewanella spongiae]MCL1076837.1 amidohydrolase [Parashewanella spongiae]RJY19205.1 amidohydrolase [Parashewanella spongiae]